MFNDYLWQERSDWVQKRVVGQERSGLILVWVFTVIWDLFSLMPVLIAIAVARQLPTMPDVFFTGFLALIFPVLGVSFTIFQIKQTRLAFQARGAYLELDRVPIPLGAVFRGQVVREGRAFSAGEATLILQAVNYFSNMGDSPSMIGVVRQIQQNVTITNGVIPVNLRVPFDGPETTTTNIRANQNRSGTAWILRVRTMEPKPFRDIYQIPIFSVPLTVEESQAANEQIAQHQAELLAHHLSPASYINIRSMPDGNTEFEVTASRAKGVVMTLGLFALTAFGLIITPSFFTKGDFPIYIQILFLFGGLLSLYGAFRACGTTHILAGPQGLAIQESIYNVPWGSTTIPLDDILSIKSASSGLTCGGVVYNMVTVSCRDGRATAARLIPDHDTAEWLALQLGDRLGKPKPLDNTDQAGLAGAASALGESPDLTST